MVVSNSKYDCPRRVAGLKNRGYLNELDSLNNPADEPEIPFLSELQFLRLSDYEE